MTYNVRPQDMRRALDAYEDLYSWGLIGSISGNAFGDIILKHNNVTWCFKVNEGKLYQLCWDNLHDHHWEVVWAEDDKYEEDEEAAEEAAERESLGENWW